MNLYRAKLITAVIAYGLIIGGIIGGLLYYVFPSYFPNWFEGILAYFLVIESLAVGLIETAGRKANQKQLLNAYMLVKVVKVLVSLVFVGIYYAVMGRDGLKSFVLIFMSFYLLFLFIETMIFIRIEKRRKLNEKKN